MGTGGSKFITLDNVAAGATAHGWWNNATAEMYRLSAWPKVAPGISASAEITQISSIVHGNPSERELHFWVKNTGTTTIDIDVWGFWWDWALKPVLEDIRVALVYSTHFPDGNGEIMSYPDVYSHQTARVE